MISEIQLFHWSETRSIQQYNYNRHDIIFGLKVESKIQPLTDPDKLNITDVGF